MTTLLVAAASMIGFIVAYNTYGRWLAKKLFGLSKDNVTPSHQLRDDVDYVPTRRSVIFGHHFTSIAGTGPIVGPALAVFWGWLFEDLLSEESSMCGYWFGNLETKRSSLD